MRFKVDENLPSEVAELLRAAGHDAVTVLNDLARFRAEAEEPRTERYAA